VIIPIDIDLNTFRDPTPLLHEQRVRYWKFVAKDLAKTYGAHPAVVGFALGNEMNQPSLTHQTRCINCDDFWVTFQNISAGLRAGLDAAGVPLNSRIITSPVQNDVQLHTYKTQSGIPVVDLYREFCNVFMVNVMMAARSVIVV